MIRGLIRDHQGVWVTSFSKNIGCCYAVLAELWGALEGLQLAWGLSLETMILEMDNTKAIEVIQANENE